MKEEGPGVNSEVVEKLIKERQDHIDAINAYAETEDPGTRSSASSEFHSQV